MSGRIYRVAALCAAALQASWALAQWSFELDTTFRTAITMKNVNALHVLQDGKVFASGRIRFAGDFSDRGSARLFPDGQRDPAYTGFFGGERIVPWINGMFYVSNGLPRRMLPDGEVDLSYGPTGIGPYFQPSTIGDYHVFPDGRVLMSGSHILSDSIRGFEGYYELIWFANTGYLDTTRTHRNANGPIYDFKELPDGKFICSCSCTEYEGQPVSRLFRVQADGALDTTFDPAINSGFFFDFHGLADGRFYAAGRFKRAVAPEDTLFVARFMPDGALDPSFSPPQISAEWLPNPLTGTLASVLFPWQDNLIFTGRFLTVNGEERSGIAMLDSAGTVLAPFGGCGVAPWSYQGFTHVSIEDIEQVGPDTLYVCGAYVGFDDCLVSDTLQRFVSRLLVSELSTEVVQAQAVPGLKFAAYPNPVRHEVTFLCERAGAADGTGLIVVRDLAVRPVAQLPMNGTEGRQTWNVQGVAPGTYVVEYLSGTTLLHTERLVVQR